MVTTLLSDVSKPFSLGVGRLLFWVMSDILARIPPDCRQPRRLAGPSLPGTRVAEARIVVRYADCLGLAPV